MIILVKVLTFKRIFQKTSWRKLPWITKCNFYMIFLLQKIVDFLCSILWMWSADKMQAWGAQQQAAGQHEAAHPHPLRQEGRLRGRHGRALCRPGHPQRWAPLFKKIFAFLKNICLPIYQNKIFVFLKTIGYSKIIPLYSKILSGKKKYSKVFFAFRRCGGWRRDWRAADLVGGASGGDHREDPPVHELQGGLRRAPRHPQTQRALRGKTQHHLSKTAKPNVGQISSNQGGKKKKVVIWSAFYSHDLWV